MEIILCILFLIFCIFAGFNGMPYMFIFPDDLDGFILFNMSFNDKK